MNLGIVIAAAMFAVAGTANAASGGSGQLVEVAVTDANLPFGDSASVGESVLSAITGEANVSMEVRAQNTSNVSNNSVNGTSVTGAIGFDSQAFQNLSGLAVVSANSGNNVSINSSLNVNVALNP